MSDKLLLLQRIALKIRLQLVIFAILIILGILELLGLIIPIHELLPILILKFKENGLLLVSLCSFLENIAGFNAYFPGSIVILSTMGLTSGFPLKAVTTFFCIYLPTILAHYLNYNAGKKLLPSDRNNSVNYWLLFFSTMWHPNFAAITCLRAGSSGMSFSEFFRYFLPSSLFWNLFWGLLMYKLGSIGNIGSSFPYIFILYLVVWTTWDVSKVIRNFNKNDSFKNAD